MNGWVSTTGCVGLAWWCAAACACVNGDTVELKPVDELETPSWLDGGAAVPDGGPSEDVLDAGALEDAEASVAMDADALLYDAGGSGYGWVRIRGLLSPAELDAGMRVTGYFTRRPYQNCSAQPLDDVCRIEVCGPPSEMPGLLSPGEVRVAGTTTCALMPQSPTSFASCQAASLWSLENSRQNVRVTASGDAFPGFDMTLAAPSRYGLSAPSGPGPFGRWPMTFRWTAEAVGEMEIALAQRPGCSEELLTRRLVCTVPTIDGELHLTQAHWTELGSLRCVSASALQRVSNVQTIDGYRLEVSVELPSGTSFDFAEPGRESCVGTHARCESFGSDEPTLCTRHGCSWQAGACTGTAHACGSVSLAECASDAGTHPGCAVYGP